MSTLARALRWGALLITVSGGPLLGAAFFGERTGWYLLGVLLTSTYVGVLLGAAILRTAGADVRAADAAAMLTLSGFAGGVLLICAVACAGGCAW